jgi:hypothetical protein
MDWMFWSIFWVVGALVSFTVLLWGIRRARVFADTSKSQKDNSPGQRAAGFTVSSSLEEFGEDLLAQELIKLRSQQSFYDALVGWLHQRSTFWLSKVLTLSWLHSFTQLRLAARAQTDLMRDLEERSNVPLARDKTASTLEADIAEEKLRGARANQERANLGKEPQASNPETEKPIGDRIAEVRQWLEGEQERLRKAGVKEGEREWELLLNEYDLRVDRIFRGKGAR